MGMKLIYACLVVLCFNIVPVLAQEQPPSADSIVSKIQSKLNLTQDQVTAITPIIEKYMSKRQEIRQSMEDGTSDRDGMRSQMKQLKEDERQELAQVLSSDQMSHLAEIQGQHKHSNDGDGQGPSMPASDNRE